MTQPTPYNRKHNLKQFSAEFPKSPHRGDYLDAEFDAVEAALDETQRNLALIQRDDGKLRNQSVHPEALSINALALVNSGTWVSKGDWVSDTDYDAGNLVSRNSATFLCLMAHTSGENFDDDNANWLMIANGAVGTTETYIDTFDGGAASYLLDFDYGDENGVFVAVGGVMQRPTIDYTVSGATLTFAEDTPEGVNNILVWAAGSQFTALLQQAQTAATTATTQAGIATAQATTATTQAGIATAQATTATTQAGIAASYAQVLSYVFTAADFDAGVDSAVLLAGFASISKENITVHFDGTFQHRATWSLATDGVDTTITFDAVIPANVKEISVDCGIRTATLPNGLDSVDQQLHTGADVDFASAAIAGLLNGGYLRATSSVAAPTSGAGVEVNYSTAANEGNVQAYDRTAGLYRGLNLRGSAVQVRAGAGAQTTAEFSEGRLSEFFGPVYLPHNQGLYIKDNLGTPQLGMFLGSLNYLCLGSSALSGVLIRGDGSGEIAKFEADLLTLNTHQTFGGSSFTNILKAVNSQYLLIGASNAANVGSNVIFYGSEHSSRPNEVMIRQGAVERFNLTGQGSLVQTVENGGSIKVRTSNKANTAVSVELEAERGSGAASTGLISYNQTGVGQQGLNLSAENDDVNLSAGGQSRLTAKEAGHVGIGTTTPVSRGGGAHRILHVKTPTLGEFSELVLEGNRGTTASAAGMVTIANGSNGLSRIYAHPNGAANVGRLNLDVHDGTAFKTKLALEASRVGVTDRIDANAGISFDGGTTVLGAYEHGTFTPTITFNGENDGLVTAIAGGAYTRIGRVVHFSIAITLTSKGTSAGAARISGLPFIVADALSGTSNEASGVIGVVVNGGFSGNVFYTAQQGTHDLALYDGQTSTIATNGDFTNTTAFRVSGTYFTG